MRFSTKTLVAVLVLGALTFGATNDSSARRGKQPAPPAIEEIDHVALAARMFKDGHLDRAESHLTQVDTKREGLDLVRFHTIAGLVALKKKDDKRAKQSFTAAIEASEIRFRKAVADAKALEESGKKDQIVAPIPVDGNLHLFLAQANFSLKDWKGCARALANAGDKITGNASAQTLWATALWNNGEKSDAMKRLDSAVKRWPDDAGLQRSRVFYLVEIGLFQTAIDAGLAYLHGTEAGAEDYVAVAEAFKRAGQASRALNVIEDANLRFPHNRDLLVQLAHIYVQLDQPLSAAMLFEQASRIDPAFRLEAAEMYRRAGREHLALALNAGVDDQEKKIKQRLAILIKMERFDMVAGMEARLSRLGLLSGEDIRYALAYAHFNLGDFSRAERHLKQLRDPSFFDKATALRKAMADCTEAGWECI